MSYLPQTRRVSNMAEMALVNPASFAVDPANLSDTTAIVEVLGHYTADDGGKRTMRWNPTSIATPDGATVVQFGATTGRWELDWDGHQIEASWFGCIADGNFLNSVTGVRFKDFALTIPATDNTVSMRAAWDYFYTQTGYDYTNSAPNVATFGYEIRLADLVFGGGTYYVATATNLFSSVRASTPNTRMGGVVRGVGIRSTTIAVRQVAPAATDYVVRCDALFPIFRDMGFAGCTGNEQLFDYSFNAKSQELVLDQVSMQNWKRAINLDGTVNGDKLQILNCASSSQTPDAIWMNTVNNTQAVANIVVGGTVVMNAAGSMIFNFEAGGATSVMAGTYEVYAGSTVVRVNGLGAQVGGQITPNLVFFGSSFEAHDTGVYADVKTGSVEYYGTKKFSNLAAPINNKWVIREAGAIKSFGGSFSGPVAFVVVDGTTWSVQNKPLLMIEGSILEDDYTSSAATNYSSYDPFNHAAGVVFAGANVAGKGRLVVTGSRAGGSLSSGLITCVNGSPDAYLGYDAQGATSQTVVGRYGVGNLDGLPSISNGGAGQVKIPLNCLIERIAIVKNGPSQAGAGIITWDVKDGDGVVLCSHTSAAVPVGQTVAEMRRVVSTNNKRILTITANAVSTNHYADGWFEVTYR